ncbi:TnsA endonuclease N-terminal domain-containing protein [Endozoicomonas numazuensis]|uniref:TnsA endonuclease N-terminal domain-containing protein n=1 Tax=Endozoicomonas numazuensis TaxID=1137799 RepID=UPI0009DFFC35|nr:TnsA endonuclease N-terminal domain-containing protein [Endozoicomonas numazuensis]
MPTRIIKKSKCNMPGLFPSLKNPDGIMYESTLERDYCYYLELDPDVRFYEGQPVTLHFEIDGKKRRYTPDFLILFHNSEKKLLVEIKREQALIDDDGLVLKLNTVREEFKQQGYEFEVKDDIFIRAKPRLQNLKKIYKYLRYSISPDEKSTILELLKSDKKYQISEIGIEAEIADPLPKVLHLAAISDLFVDISYPIDLYSLVWQE